MQFENALDALACASDHLRLENSLAAAHNAGRQPTGRHLTSPRTQASDRDFRENCAPACRIHDAPPCAAYSIGQSRVFLLLIGGPSTCNAVLDRGGGTSIAAVPASLLNVLRRENHNCLQK